jgi:hypothetical protein
LRQRCRPAGALHIVTPSILPPRATPHSFPGQAARSAVVVHRDLDARSDEALEDQRFETFLVPHQATFALFTTSRRRSSWACLFRQMM